MSLILDALNRSRQDANAVPGLDTQHHIEPLPAEGRPYLLWAALGLCGVVIVWLVVDRLRAPALPAEDIGAPVAQLSQNLGSAVLSATNELKARAAAGQAQQPVAQAPQTSAQPTVASGNPEAAIQASTATPGKMPTAPSTQSPPQSGTVANQAVAPAARQAEPVQELLAAEPVAARSDPARPDPARVAASEIARSATSAPEPATQDEEVAQLYAHPDAAEEPVAAARSRPQSAAPNGEQRVDLDKVLKIAQEEMKNAKLEDNGIPFLTDLSQQTKDAIPTIYYQKHDFSSDPAVSSVTLNGSTVKVGGSPVPGLKVEEILGDSVVLSFQGTQFRLRALSSWVNL